MDSCRLLLAVSPTTTQPPSIHKPRSQIFYSKSSPVLRHHCSLTLKPSRYSDHKFPRNTASHLHKRWKFSFSKTSQRWNGFQVRATAVPDNNAHDPAVPNELFKSLQLASMFGVWYLLNIYFNIYNKQVLKVFPHPATVSAFQFGCGTVLVLLMWSFNLHPRPKITRSHFSSISPLALGHTLGNFLTNVSLGKVAVSFTHSIKAMEPFFTVVLAALFLGERPSFWVLASLVPIVGGVALASFTDASFNWIGFGSAMASNLTNQSRNVYSKMVIEKKNSLDNINLFSLMTILSFILLVPIALLIDGIKLSPSSLQHAAYNDIIQAGQGLNVQEFWTRSLLAGFCFHSYQQVSYMILQMVSPVTHSVGNSFKRVVVVVSSVIFFQTPVSTINALGTAIALAGVFLYSRAKRIKPTPKVA